MQYDLQTIRVFRAVADTGSLTLAAEACSLTLSAVSKRMAELEELTGNALLSRHPRGVFLTAAGEALARHAQTLLDQVHRMSGEMNDFSKGLRGHVRIWGTTSAIVQFLPEDLSAFLAVNPAVKVSVEEKLSAEIMSAVGAGLTDIGLFSQGIDSPKIRRSIYRRDELVLVVPKKHRFASMTSIKFADALDEDYVGLVDGSALMLRMSESALRAGKNLRVRMQLSGFDSAARMVEAGLGIGVLPRGVYRFDSADSTLCAVQLDEDWAIRTLYVATREGHELSPEAARLFRYLAADGN